ncbi:MAG: HdeA/HdeB family chaperone [Alphaproteobacteria bacterium]
MGLPAVGAVRAAALEWVAQSAGLLAAHDARQTISIFTIRRIRPVWRVAKAEHLRCHRIRAGRKTSMRSKAIGLALGTGFAVGMAFNNAALGAERQVTDLTKLTCRQVLMMYGEEQRFVAIFFHGFVSGRKNETMFDGPQLAETTDKIRAECIDKPDTRLLSVFEKYRK